MPGHDLGKVRKGGVASLDRLHVRGWKSLDDVDLHLQSLNVLIGANGAGKSNFISLFPLLRALAEQDLQVFVKQAGGADELLHRGHTVRDVLFIDAHFGENSYELELGRTNNDGLMFRRKIVYWHNAPGGQPWTRNLSSGHVEARLPEAARQHKGAGDDVLQALKS